MTRGAPIEAWIEQARTKLRDSGLQESDLDELAQTLQTPSDRRRQRLLYLQAVTPSIRSEVIGIALHEPVSGSVTEISADARWPYTTVHAAIVDGWQVISFPAQRVPFDDREIDVLGYEFVLQKLEEVSNG